MLEMTQTRTIGSPRVRYSTQDQQPRKLMLALVLLLVALVAVLAKDRQFWFGSEQATIEQDIPETQPAAPQVAPVAPTQPPVAAKKQIAAVKVPLPAKSATTTKTAEAPVVTTRRTALPPLEVEVVAGDSHRTVHPANNASKIQIVKPATSVSAQSQNLAAPVKAAELAPADAIPMQQVQPSINTAYPLLTPHMFVQGSVVLQAIIGVDGQVENLTMVSGPAILASAAQQAVRGWHFKPIFMHGQAVESKAMITVNFTINVADRGKNS
jgi:protein TonB